MLKSRFVRRGFAAGEANIGVWLSSEQCADLGGCVVAPSVETIFIRPDTHGPMFSDIRVREAFHLAIDTEGIVDPNPCW
ncbi:MAG: hypothetical protein Ct9H300mP12_09850 [Acidimicrobiales bacterium]|nr:MAG: hypothetical protein Ct9H300mP12_09850 [Acidimicrobiales bacterium]